MKYLMLVAALCFFSCEEERLSEEELQTEMNAIATRIDSITDIGCKEKASCKAIPIGIKACGGPTHYIIYSTVTNEDELTKLIITYNNLNKQYNEASGALSDCALEVPPMLNCISGECEEVR